MDRFTFSHQEPHLLENELKACLGRHATGKARENSAASLNGGLSDEALGKALCDILIDYCGFKIGNHSNIDPFDDPFVGAAIVTAGGRVLGSHRKESRNEPHAEAVAMILALDAVGGETAQLVRRQIFEAYDRTLWLRSQADRDRFVALFQEAGSLVRSNTREPFLLLSTLEPCRDFETQPGCSHLISAFRPDLVFYASDDTNEKGQGRPILERGGLTVFPNLSPINNVSTNLLFYATVHFLEALNHQSAKAHDSFELFYSNCNLATLVPLHEFQGGRLVIRFSEPARIYRAAVEVRAPMAPSHVFDRNCVDSKRVLFLNHFSASFLADYLQRYLQNTGCVPGVIVCSRAASDEIKDLSLSLQRSNIRVYSNVFRKSDEHFAAIQSIRRWRESRVGSSHLHIVVKADEGYSSRSGQATSLLTYLMEIASARKISVYLHVDCLIELFNLLQSLRYSRAFEDGQHLQRVSILAVIAFPSEALSSTVEEQLGRVRHWLQEQSIAARVIVSYVCEELREPEVLQSLVTGIASGLIDPLSLEPGRISKLLDSENWKGRQAAGWLLSASVARNPDLYEEIITKRLPNSFTPSEWRRSCSVLNAVGKSRSLNRPRSGALFSRLIGLSQNIDDTIRLGSCPEPLRDVVWRLNYAVCAIAETAEEVQSLLGSKNLRQYIGSSPFLLKELFSFASRSAQSIRCALPYAVEIARASAPDFIGTQRLGVRNRLVRLSTIARASGFQDASLRLLESASALDAPRGQKDDEADLCQLVLSEGLSGVFRSAEAPRALCSYLFLQTSNSAGSFKGIATTIAEELAAVIAGPISGGESVVSWRGDKTPLARVILSEVSDNDLLKYLRAMADDEDDTVRWAALVLAFDPGLRLRITGDLGCKKACVKSRLALAEVIDATLGVKPHYWLLREFLTLFHGEHAGGKLPAPARLQASDLGTARDLLRTSHCESLHPEVSMALNRWQAEFCRIALVLPPLTRESQETTSATTSTPALGLASLASFLESRGHVVDLYDIHRFPELSAELIKSASNYEFVGISVVSSTFTSSREITAEIKAAVPGSTPKIVLGGHAVTLQPNDFVNHRSFQWDYLVLGDGELPFTHLVENYRKGTAVVHQGLVQRTPVTGEPFRPYRMASDEWTSAPWINRQLFRGPTGASYEPAVTRNRSLREAHVVMSRGCSWKCNFCTEAILRGNSGEARRSPEDVVAEIKSLISSEGVDRIQFVDDNLLPQIAAPKVDRSACLNWTSSFLAGLTEIRQANPGFGWRGIFRLEDFIAYENQHSSWFDILSCSGCSLLAFGVEHGSENTRRQLKGETVSNADVKTVIASLKKHRIATKGYFIIGGPGESAATSQATIDLAIDSGFTLAYFALYKHFRRLIEISKANIGSSENRERRFLTFRTLQADFDDRLVRITSDVDCVDSFGEVIPKARLQEAIAAIGILKEKGFKFEDLFKYNDFHDFREDETTLKVWDSEARGSADFLRCVRKAYLQFYARSEFIENYELLLLSGY